MALTDYSMVGKSAYCFYMVGKSAYCFYKIEDGKRAVVCISNDAVVWIENTLLIRPERDIYGNNTYYLTDEQLTAFILKFGK